MTEASRRLAEFVERRAGTITWLSLVFAIVAGWLASDLGVDSRMRRLLPDDYPSVAGIDEATARLGNQSDLYLTIHGPDPEANRRFGAMLRDAIVDHPDLRWVQLRRDWTFFEDHALLYAELDDLLQLRREVIGRIRREVARKAYGGLSLAEDDDEAAAKESEADDPFDPDHIRARYGLEDDELPEYLEADEGRVLVVWARPKQPATDLEFGDALQEDMRRIIEELDPTSVHPEMTVTLDGAFAYHARNVKSLSTGIRAGTALAILGVLGSIGLYFRSARAVLLVLGPVALASLAALAFAAVTFGVLNLITAFIFAILVGLGIDFGIHLLGRYRDERTRGHDHVESLAIMYAGTGRSTFAGALGTALAFGSLSIADFEGFSQFGIVAAVGIGFSLLTTGLVMPAWMLVLERRFPWRVRTSRSGLVFGLVPRATATALAVAVAGVVLAAGGATLAPRIEFEYDFGKLGPREDESDKPDGPSFRDAIGRASLLAPAVAYSDDEAQIERLYRQLAIVVAMTEQEARDLTPIDPRRVMELRRAVEPDYDGPPPKPMKARSLEPEDGEGDDDWDDDDDDDPFGDEDLDDPVFVALETKVANAKVPTGTTLDSLQTYEPQRRETMANRLVAVTAVQAFVPEQQADKLTVIADIRHRIDAKYADLSEESRRQLDEWKTQLAVAAPIGLEDLPEWVRSPFLDTDGQVGRFLVFRTAGAKADVENAARIYGAFRTLADPDGEVRTAADFFVIPEIFEAVGRDGPRVLTLALIAMLISAGVSLRSLGGTLAVSLVVLVSMAWLLGVLAIFGLKLSIFNLIALPLLIGMAQDDALHVYQRWREEGRARLSDVLHETGSAVLVTTATTMFGFAGLLAANHRGLQSLAITAVAGMALAWVASVTVLPATLYLASRWRR